MTRKSNGKNCAYKMLEVGFPDGETYEADLAAAKPETDVYDVPMATMDPNFKEILALAKFRNQITIKDAKVDQQMYDALAAALGDALMTLFMASVWAKHQGQHSFVELYCYYRLDVLLVCPSVIEEIMAAAIYDPNHSFDENMALLLSIIEAVQPHEAVSQYQQMRMMMLMTKGIPAVRRAHANYQQKTPKFEEQSLQEAIKSISRELRNNPGDQLDHASSINSVRHEEMMEINNVLMQNLAIQEARINQLATTMNTNNAAVAATPGRPNPPRPTTKYCHLHGSNNTHDGTECKKMGSPGFTMKGKAVTQAMINNGVPGAMVDGVAGRM